MKNDLYCIVLQSMYEAIHEHSKLDKGFITLYFPG